MIIKVCGLTNADDVRAALDLGADYVGFVFYPRSPRYIDPETVAHILAGLGRPVGAVGVFVNASRPDVEAIASCCQLRILQLHGDEKPNAFCHLAATIWRAIRFSGSRWHPRLASWPMAACYVVDARVAGLYGGTGVTADWAAARKLAACHPVVLSGGLTPDNVVQAIHSVRPMGVDVCSGVESCPGQKDHRKLRAFIERARLAAQRMP